MMFDLLRQRASLGMHWQGGWDSRGQDTVRQLLEDLEMQADGLELAERAAEVDELSVAHYAEVELIARLHASVGSVIRASLTDGLELHGRLTAAGADWVLLEDEGGQALFASLPHVVTLTGVDARSLPEEARPMGARLSLRSVLRRLAEAGGPCTLQLSGDRTLRGTVVRVGADFLELVPEDAADPITVPLTAVALVRGRP